jgi:hypothetical protein
MEEEKIEAILKLLEKNDVQTKQQILLECAAQIGTQEWAQAVNDLISRMEELNKN